MADTDESKADEVNEAPQKPRSNIGLIVAFVAMVVMVETGMFFFLVPSADEVSALAEQSLIESVQEGQEETVKQEYDENQSIEFNLGDFGETFSPIDTERMYTVEITLFGLIRKKNLEKMEKEFESKQGRLRHAIRMKIRNSELTELKDNQLALLQRRILTTCNHLLDEDLLLGVGFHNYQLREQ
ncbi:MULTISPECIES: dihydrolipoamide acetyltransferase [Crateriforma]|uniref:Flagellar basal body-associated protein FliL n=1 Tax=Crateriforma conspicua TaxID=2527996 RepID=A0A5C6FQ52_9PLAN|nr:MULTISPECIES: dihydrolipoamide acetyltransferase [Crateriforma]TWU65252.1 hypothetical protein V7x_07980 [Crateriforma conspicua]